MSTTPTPAKAEKHADRAHHPYSPSKLAYLEASPAFESRDEANEASLAGTLQHEAVEAPNLDKFAAEHSLTDEQYAMVSICRDRKKTLRTEMAAAIGCRPEEMIEVAEEYLPIDDRVLEDGTKHTSAGFLDFALVSPCKRVAAIVDWKFGQWQVDEAKENLQGITYLLGLRRRYPTLEQIHVEFQMPYLNWSTSHLFTIEEYGSGFAELYARVRRVVTRAVLARKKFDCVARPLTCSFCDRIGSCPLAAKMFGHVTAKLNDTLEVPKVLDPLLLKDPADGAALLKFSRVAEAWAVAVRRQLSLLASDDKRFVPEDYVLRVQNNRMLANPEMMVSLLKSKGVSEEDIDAAYKIGLTECEKLLRAVTPRGRKDAVVDEVWEAAEKDGIIGREPETKIFLQHKRTSVRE